MGDLKDKFEGSTSLGQLTPWRYDPEDKKENVIDFVKKLCEYKADEIQDLVNGKYGPMKHGLLDTSVESAYFVDNDTNDDFYPYYYDDDDVDYDTEDDYNEDTNDDSVVNLVPRTFCGFRRSFLCPQDIPQSNFSSNNTILDLKMPTRHRITAEEAEKNANELVAEEERIKNKAEKKRLKKKRQKDRKRQEKLEEELKDNKENKMEKYSINECSRKEEKENKNNVAGSVTGASEKESRGAKERNQCNNIGETADKSDEDDETEDELDLCSTFVSQVRRKVDKKPKVEKKDRAAKLEGKEPVKKVVENIPETNLLDRSMTLAGLGNEMAKFQYYKEAVTLFTQAIILNPREYRLFGNRSYCYERMLQYKEALNDAEVALSLMPYWPKGYFRKGKALMGLKRYDEAKCTFEAVLKADKTHVDAACELQRCQMQILLERRCVRENEHKPQVPELFPRILIPQPPQPLLPAVKIENMTKMAPGFPCSRDLKMHDANGSAMSLSYKNKIPTPSEVRGNVKEEAGSKLKAEPLKLRQLYPIWVGNVTSRIAEKNLKSLFEQFGHIHSIRILYDRTCAFINFSDKEAAERAFYTLQGIHVEGTTFLLQLRNPEHANITLGAARTNLAQKPLPKEQLCL
uniref:Tetratricopeptide repeat protein 31 isoform X2 n=1 Tax=Geotrypetes seraphini TaxID=260995 RepID=A0A6P8RYY5_GEOSA|nr:tetratricopeptide repeat protein 31 isoform X2 [Geotrypetes seraphini]XP_033810828.1 tetratricopeptide repeat protein 31 isoform X2 [Geotrypetes seraphini]